MNERAKKLIDEIRPLVHADMPQERFDDLVEPICDLCRELDLKKECPLGRLLFLVFRDAEIAEEHKMKMTLEHAKQIINAKKQTKDDAEGTA